MRYAIPLSFLLSALSVGMVDAQWGGRWGGGGYGGGAYVNNKASTVGESHARGMSDVIQSRAWANKTNSEAMINMTEVRSNQLDNRAKTADTYFSMRNMNREQRFGTPEQKAAHRAANQERFARYAQAGNPKRPTSRQLDPITGEINWPFSLMPEKFEPYREGIQKVFSERARQGGAVNYQDYKQVKDTTDQLLAALNSEIKNIEPGDYVSAKRFISQLTYEVQNGGS